MEKLFISDLDGTLLNKNGVLSVNTIKIINENINLGINFTIATARSYESSRIIIKELNLNLPVILHNGALIYDIKEKKYIKSKLISNHDTYKLLKIFNDFN